MLNNKMFRYPSYFSLLILIVSGSAYSQSDYYSYTLDNFRKAKEFKETIVPDNLNLEKLNAVIFYLTNEQRVHHKLNVLNYHQKLEESAALHSGNMVKDVFFSHYHPKNKKLRDPNDRARHVGIVNPFLAENIVESFVLQYKAGDEVYPIAKGVFSYKQNGDPIPPHTYLSLGETMIDRWMNSPQHSDNVLSKKAVQLGCGTAFYLKEDFNEMPTVIATQNFQLYEPVRVNE